MESLADLPRPATGLIGRDRDRRAVANLLALSRLLTLSGPGGVGKTRLALQVADDLAGTFAHGVAFVALAPVAHPAGLLPAIAQAVGLDDRGDRPALEALAAHLRDRELLLVLDNFEHLAGAAPLVASLLAATRRLRLIVTSRAVLRLSAEQEYPVRPLSWQDEPGWPLAEAAPPPAVRLFVERARAARPDFAPGADDLASIAAICRRLDGLPLAIELAAARTRLLGPAALLARLDHSLALLTDGPRDLPARHQALRDAIAWSYDLLDPADQALFRRLAVFACEFGLAAAEALCADLADAERPIFARLSALAEQSLIVAAPGGPEPRFSLLETIREFAAERLAAAGEAGELRRRHDDYFLALAEAGAPQLTGPGHRDWIARLAADQAGLRAALGRLLDPAHSADPEPGLRMAAALYRFWWMRGQLREGHAWLQAAITRASDGLPIAALRSPDLPAAEREELRARLALRVQVLSSAGEFVRDLDGAAAAAAFHEAALALTHELGDRRGVARALTSLGRLAHAQGLYPAARARYEEALAIYRELDEPWQVAQLLQQLALTLYWQGELDQVEALSGRSLAMMGAIGNPHGMAYASLGLGKVLMQRGAGAARERLSESLALMRSLADDRGAANALAALAQLDLAAGGLADARARVEESLRLFAAIEDTRGRVYSLVYLGEIARAEGRHDAARELYAESVGALRQSRDRCASLMALEGLAALAAAQGAQERAAELFGAAAALRAALAIPRLPLQQARLAADEARAVRAAPEAAERGRALSLEAALSLALSPLPQIGARGVGERALPDDLTSRELEVLQLVAAGLSNQAIAEALTLSVYTIQAHLRSIFGKLQVPSRAAAARYAWEHGLAGAVA